MECHFCQNSADRTVWVLESTKVISIISVCFCNTLQLEYLLRTINFIKFLEIVRCTILPCQLIYEINQIFNGILEFVKFITLEKYPILCDSEVLPITCVTMYS